MADDPAFPTGREALLAGYERYAAALARGVPDDPPETDADERAYDAVEGVVRSGPAHLAWELVVVLLRRAPEDDRLGALAVGPLEILLQRRAAEVVEWVEAEAARDARFRWALGCVWLDDGDAPPAVIERLVRASGGRIRPTHRRAARPPPEPAA